MNHVDLIGRLTRDPELRRSASGNAFCSFTVAVNRRMKQEGQPEADFISCKAFGKTAELLHTYQHKGNQIGIEGRIQTGSYDKDGQRVYTTDVIADSIIFLDKAEKPKQAAGGYMDRPYIKSYGGETKSFSEFSQEGRDIYRESPAEDLPF